MEALLTWGALLAGFALLFAGGESLVRGASGLARRAGVSPLLIGVTIVAFGTSAPELVVSVLGAARGEDAIAVGNVVGSNIFNVLFVLGLCALLRPLVVAQQLVLRDVPVKIAASLAFWLFALDGRVSVVEGLLFLIALALFTFEAVRTSRRESDQVAREYDEGVPPGGGALRDGAFVLGGLALLVVGARWLVDAAETLALAAGIDETVVGLTIVAAGTSAPEVATSLVATLRGQRDIAVGNVVGSSIFNLLGILGLAAVVGGGLELPAALVAFDAPIMVGVALALVPLLARAHRLERVTGAFFLAYYAAYVTYLVLSAKQHAALPGFTALMVEVVLPLTVAALIAWGYARRAGRGPASAPETT